jgi:putative SOS response-associated peptidase YedK
MARAENRGLMPFTSFSEYDTIDGKKVPVWFAPDESRPPLAFAGLWTNWTSVRKPKGEVTADVYAFRDASHSNDEATIRRLATRAVGRSPSASVTSITCGMVSG